MQPLRFGWPAALAATAVAATACFFAPSIGLAAALVVLAAGAFAVSIPSGLVMAAIAAVWWAAVGRTRPAAAAVPAFAPLAAVARVAFALPPLAGFFLDGFAPAAAAGAGAAVAVVATSTLRDAAATPLALSLGTPYATQWWARAAIAGRHVRGRRGALVRSAHGEAPGPPPSSEHWAGSRSSPSAQVPWMTGGSRPPPAAMLQLLLALILVVVVVALGPPVPAASGDDGTPREEGT